MKKFFKFCVCLIILVATVLACPHVHNQECGYDINTNSGCVHEHEESCYEEKDTIWTFAGSRVDCVFFFIT